MQFFSAGNLINNGEGSSRSPLIPNNKDLRPAATEMQTAASLPPLVDRQHYGTPSSVGLMEVWASVASWFLRPECSSLLTTMAGADPNFATAMSTTSRSAMSSGAAGSGPPNTPQATTTTTAALPATTSTTSSASSSSTSSTSSSSSSSACIIGKSSLHLREAPTRERVFQAPTICTAIRCTVPSCTCECFVPGKRHLRYCETCKHGWVPHALDKLGTRHLFRNSAPEPVQPNAAFDIASLVLYGCQALPIRLKILLDRLFSVLQKDQVLQVLHGFGWTPEDYARGYILQQESHVNSLDRWSICSPEEEPLVLQQFLRFGETRAITQQLLLAQQVLQEPTLERLERLASPAAARRAMSPSRRPNSPTIPPPSVFHASRMPPAMSPHQKQHPLSFLKLPPTNNGPVTSTSPSTSPLNAATSPLNRLQSMQPFDFRKFGAGLGAFSSRLSPDMAALNRRRTSDSEPPSMGLNLSMSTSLSCLPPPPPPIPSSLNHSAAAIAAAASVNSLAAASLVQSFPGLMSSKMSTSTGSKSPSSSDFMGNNPDATTPSEDEDMDENSYSALNLSRDKEALKAPRQARGIPGRKPSTPTKRHWGSPGLPLNLGTQFINPATGKKRVQCNVCLKTFCDKGALKIHFSAVHLREMHKCTVEGCNMMFSSRRSRNRHSANPNPKLHSPHLRRKISPHDGRSAQPHPILIPPQGGLGLPQGMNPLNPFNPFPLLTPPPDMRHPAALALDYKQSLDLTMAQRNNEDKLTFSDYSSMQMSSSNHEDDDDDDDDDGIVVVGGVEDEESRERMIDSSTNGISDQPEDFSMPTKKAKISISDFDEEIASNIDSNEDSLSVVDAQSLKDTSEECVLPTNKRKRKSQNPTRCAIAVTTRPDDDEDEDPTSDGDYSNDVFMERISSIKKECDELKEPEDEHSVQASTPEIDNAEVVNLKQEPNPKNDDAPPSPAYNNIDDNDEDDEAPLNLGKRSPDVNANEKPEKTLVDQHEQHIKKEKTPVNDDEASSVESHKSDESFDCSNALRQLESLSHGHFGDLVGRGLHLGLGGQTHIPHHLGFMIAGGPPSPARSQASSTGSSNGGESPDESNHIYGHFDNGQFISTMDVPIDKDNPRRCTACGKVFQNHFGVKTHYQNVHLKLMHKCNVDGCNAAFPSKRSRDRHSANLNLHRKLLSTSSDVAAASLFMDKSPFASLAGNPSLHGDLLARLYADDAFKGHHLPAPGTLEQLMLNGDRLPPPPLLLPPLGGLPFPLGGFNHFAHLNGSSVPGRKERNSGSTSPLSASPPPLNTSPGLTTTHLVHCVEEDMPSADKEGNLPCRLCRASFPSALALKEHCEKLHLFEMHRCTVPGCMKAFLSKTKRNVHADNEALHRHEFITKGLKAESTGS